MKGSAIKKLKQAEKALGVEIPGRLFSFICNLRDSEVNFGNETWLFPTLTDKAGQNFIIKSSRFFKQEWGIEGLVFAENGLGDELLLLHDKDIDVFTETVYVMMHETAEIKIFAGNIEVANTIGPSSYFWSDDFYLKLDEGTLVEGAQTLESVTEAQALFDDEDYRKKDTIDDWIDDERTEKLSEILTGLEELTVCEDKHYKIWALDKLSDLYLKGFGPLPKDLGKALLYNQQAIDLGSHKALSNRAACYFAGIGMERDLNKALELAKKANELSKKNHFADIFAAKEGGGMYDELVIFIEKEIERQNKS